MAYPSGTKVNYSYDAAGDVIGDGANTFSYSDRGRLSSATNAGGTVNYLCNGVGQRVAKTGPTALVPTGAAYFVYDERGQLLGEYDANNITVALYNVFADHLATPRMITRQSDQAIVWRWDTAEAFGATAANQNPSALGIFTFNPRFPGQVFDAETGLFDNWNRTYDARQGRYRQSDPIGLAGGINTFAYVGGNPLSFTDPMGLHKGDKWYGRNNREFQRWFHNPQCWKQPGNADADQEEIEEAYAEWLNRGSPTGGKCGNMPPPPPPPAPACDEACKKTATVVVVGGTAYLVYRCLRMLPSLLPPFWPSIPINVVVP